MSNDQEYVPAETNDYPPPLLTDAYKQYHPDQYAPGTEFVQATWIPRSTYLEGVTEAVAFGFQAFAQRYLVKYWQENFFDRNEDEVVTEFVRFMKFALNTNTDGARIRALHQLGYLPVVIKAVPEGTLVPLRVPMLTIENTLPEFFWVTNSLETLMSCELWQPAVSATISHTYRKMLDKASIKTTGSTAGVEFQGHDFSFRGMEGVDAAAASGAAHLLSFVGTDTLPAILFHEKYYGANIETELVGTSIPATEHAVMCSYGKDNEEEAYRHLIEDVYQTGFISAVSDTYNLWDVLTKILPKLKDSIMERDGRVVIRPDSGDPADIICGDPNGETENERKGVVELLWELFGGAVNEQGYKVLDSHIGMIYGDSITTKRTADILARLEAKGFYSQSSVLGIGSYTYQYQTRDSLGLAMKSTWVMIGGVEHNIFKDPYTDKAHIKRSLTGRVVVRRDDNGVLAVTDGLSIEQQAALADEDILQTIFRDGKLYNFQTLAEIRGTLAEQSAVSVA